MGLGSGTSTGTVGLLAPTLDITHTGQEETLDGVRIVFQLTPGTEAPAEMNFHYRMELSNGALIHHPTTRTEPADLAITLTRPQLLAMLGGASTDGVQFDGDPKIFATIAGLTDEPDPWFRIITP